MNTVLHVAAPDPSVVASARLQAAMLVWNGRDSPASRRYIQSCWRYDRPTLTAIIFTRESGYHSGGWWKNPDYERCYHLSLRNLAFQNGEPISLPYNWKMARRWVEAFFGDDARLTWHEGPYSDMGKVEQVHHYRLFCDEAWKPIKPRGEVYSKDWTPAEWKSFSDIHADPTPPASTGSVEG